MNKNIQKPTVYEGKWTPIFEDVPEGLLLADRAVYGFVVRMEHLNSGKCTASANTIAQAIGTNEKTVDRSLKRLEDWKLILCVYRGKNKKEASHFTSLSRTQWMSDEIKEIADKKTQNRKGTRVNLSSTRVNLSEARVKLTHKDTIRNIKETENLIKNFDNDVMDNKPTPPLTTKLKKPANKTRRGAVVPEITNDKDFWYELPE